MIVLRRGSQTKNFWRPEEKSPSKQGYHWNSNAETYHLIGEAMGEAMIRLLGAKSHFHEQKGMHCA